MRYLNVNKMVNRMQKRRNSRNKFWLSLVGIGLAGGATAYSMSRGKSNDTMQQLFKKASNSIGNMMPNTSTNQ